MWAGWWRVTGVVLRGFSPFGSAPVCPGGLSWCVSTSLRGLQVPQRWPRLYRGIASSPLVSWALWWSPLPSRQRCSHELGMWRSVSVCLLALQAWRCPLRAALPVTPACRQRFGLWPARACLPAGLAEEHIGAGRPRAARSALLWLRVLLPEQVLGQLGTRFSIKMDV